MSLNPSFTIGNNAAISTTFLVTDGSTGSDSGIAGRVLYLYNDANTLLYTVQFPLSAGSTISPAILTYDLAYNAVMTWVDGSGNVLYTTSIIGVFTGFTEWFLYGLSQEVASQPNILNDQEFVNNWSKLDLFVSSAKRAISTAGSVVNAQNMISLAQQLTQNSQLNF